MRTVRVLAVLAACAAPAIAQEPILEFHGTDSGGELGMYLDGGADLDGDGHDDLLVAAYADGLQGTGSVYVYSGADGHVIHAFHGQAPNDLFGVSAAFAGDADADGVSDVIVAARVPGSAPGYVRLFSGSDGHVVFTDYTQPADGAVASYESVDGIGDVNSDGRDDVVVAIEPNDLVHDSTLRVLSGADGALLFAIPDAGVASAPVRGAGDLDADGVPDFVYGDQYHDIPVAPGIGPNKFVGAVRAFSGLDGSLLHEWIGGTRGDHFGYSVDGIGDLNADGYDDVVAGAIQEEGGHNLPGYVRIESGKDGSLIHEWVGQGHGDDLGSAVARAGDVDGDGHEDLLVGDKRRHFTGLEDGSVRVISGRDFTLLFEFFGHTGPMSTMSESSEIGRVVRSAGDVDADGLSDIVFSAHVDSSVVSWGGSVWVFSGREFAWHETPSPSITPAGSPKLSAFGALERGNTISALITDAEPFQPCWIVAGLSQAPTPFLGGVLVPTPDVIAGPIALNPSGGFLLTSEVAAVPAGTTICLQAWSVSASATSGFVGSNAIEATAD